LVSQYQWLARNPYKCLELEKPGQIEDMTIRIIQNHPERGTREFELVDDAIEYRIANRFGEEELSVVLSVLQNVC